MTKPSLSDRIKSSVDSSDVIETTLKTSERVLARVTDGIYRQPGSALRELVANAYDADASRVVVRTDRPRFSTIRVEDDGLGMTPEAVAHLLENIGGSAKRRTVGAELGVTSPDDPLVSPGGRRLIGRIGIGLFSVSQLTQSFQISTKVKGDQFRTVATVVLRQYADVGAPDGEEDGERYEAGKVKIWREPATDVDGHGTAIVLDNIRPQTRRTLQSNEIWSGVEAAEAQDAEIRGPIPLPPQFHIGRIIDGDDGDALRTIPGGVQAVPWATSSAPNAAFRSLVDAVWDSIGQSTRNPQIEILFDYYLQMVWQLALSVPLAYVDGHPFEISFGSTTHTYSVPVARKEAATEVKLKEGESLAARCGLTSHEVDGARPFEVFVDDLLLARPLRFKDLPTTGHALKKPILFVGKCRETFKEIPTALSGGPLDFEAYLLWNPKIAPTEHQGSLIRIHGASGTLFDPTFMRYQVSEQTRKQQITCEIFVTEGLEYALNIDRESFNYAHPHVVFLTNWLHNALRKLASTQKALAAAVRETERQKKDDVYEEKLEDIVRGSWTEATGDEDLIPPRINFGPADGTAPSGQDDITLDRDRVFGEQEPRRGTPKPSKVERQLSAIANVLTAHGLTAELSSERLEDVLRAIRQILQAEET